MLGEAGAWAPQNLVEDHPSSDPVWLMALYVQVLILTISLIGLKTPRVETAKWFSR